MVLCSELGGGNFNDKRLSRRAVFIGERFIRNPDKSIPSVAGNWGTVKAFYRFFNNNKITRSKLLLPHHTETKARCEAAGDIIVIQDTTTISYGTHPAKRGFGVTGTRRETGNGMLVHSSLAVDLSSHEPLGIVNQDVIIRNGFYPDEDDSRTRLNRPRESQKWINGVTALKALLPAKREITIVADREADYFCFIKTIIDFGFNFVIRQTRERKTDAGLFSKVLSRAEPKGVMTVHIRRNSTRKERTATVRLKSLTAVQIHSPGTMTETLPSIPVNVLLVQEEGADTQEKEKLLSWVLLTNMPVETEAECQRVARCYQARWIIEEFHKGLKTGCGIEQRRLVEEFAMENVLGIFSVIAVILLHLRFCARQKSNSIPYTEVSEIQKTILCHQFKKPPETITIPELLICIARLGGFLARKGDGNPGWITLFKGYMKLIDLEQGYTMAMELMGKR